MNLNYRRNGQIVINVLFAWIGFASDRGTGSELLCYQVSGPAYALLRNFAADLSLDNVDSQIFENLSTLGPIKAIIVCASSHEISLNERLSNFEEMIRTPTPFLAVIKRQEQSRDVFEFVLVEAMKGDSFLVYEFRSHRGWREYKLGTFKRLYAGSILTLGLPENSQNSWIKRAQIFLFGFAAMFIFITLVKRRNRCPAFTLTMAVCLVMSGCNQADHAQRSAGNLSVLNPEISLGAKSQKEAISVVFRVKTGESELSLTEITTDCGCLQVPTGFHDKSFPPQSEFELDFTLSTGDQVGDQSHWARITGLAKGKSETVECGVNYSVIAKPEISPEPIVLRRIKGGHS